MVEWSLGFFSFFFRTVRMNAVVREGFGLGEFIFGMI